MVRRMVRKFASERVPREELKRAFRVGEASNMSFVLLVKEESMTEMII